MAKRVNEFLLHPFVIKVKFELSKLSSRIGHSKDNLPFTVTTFRVKSSIKSLEEPTSMVSIESDIGVHGFSSTA